MKKVVLATILLGFACNSSQKTLSENQGSASYEIPDPTKYAETITEEDLKTHLYTYSSDEFEGRLTGSEGQKKAVNYIKAAYQKLKIPSAKANGDYFQKVPIENFAVPEGDIQVNNSVYKVGKDIITFTPALEMVEEIVYVGYGIEEGDYSDYKNLDVTNKVILMKFGEPQNADGAYLLSGTSTKSKWSNMSEAIAKRQDLATKKGAKGILYYDPINFPRYKGYFEFMKTSKSGQMQLKENTNEPFFILLNDAAAKGVLSDIEKNTTPQKVPLQLKLNVSSAESQVDTENVIAYIKGSEKPDEYVIISSHLDHIGVLASGDINNGADDDGSGTVAMLEIAEAFKMAIKKGDAPKRSIVFLHVTGEEKGLLGSKYYTDVEPIFPLKQTVADLNIDMIGRIDPKRDGDRNYIYLIGSDKISTELHELSEAVNTKYTQLELDYKYNDDNDPNRFYYRSDHYNFAKNNIPIIFYFNGTHPDYHQPSDTPDKINYDLLQKRAQLVFYTAWEVANRQYKVAVDSKNTAK